tara:strand:+ start:43 stop:840 length:798 start_codon:yes stop_codon:yes gene_type:complete
MSAIKNREKFFISKNRIVIYLIFLIFFLLITTSVFYRNNIFSYLTKNIQLKSEIYGFVLKDIQITGNNKVEESEIINLIYHNYNKSIFLVSLKKIKKELINHIWIEDFNVKINYPSLLSIYIEEKIPIAIFQTKENKYFYLDNKGKKIEETEIKKTENLIIYKGNAADTDILNLIKILDSYDDFDIKFAEYIGERRWDLTTNHMLKIKLPEKNYELAIDKISKFLIKLDTFDYNLIEFIDLRIDKKIIIRFYDKNDIEFTDNDLK